MMTAAEKTVYELVKAARNKEHPDTEKLNEIRDHYGYDLYIEALRKVTAEMATEKTIDELWMAACSGDMETLKAYYTNGGEVNRRYSKFGRNHSLIAGAYRNGNFATVSYLYEVGETPEEHEKSEVKYSPFAVVVIRQNGDTERIGFNDKYNARKIFRCMCEIAVQSVENIAAVCFETECKMTEQVSF